LLCNKILGLLEMRKWRCSVCGYVHTGPEPPQECPVCGADRSKFIEIPSDAASGDPQISAKKTPSSLPPSSLVRSFSKLNAKLHFHPISVHIPNGVLPVSIIFLFFGIIFHLPQIEKAAYFNLIFVVLAMPVVLITGYIDWKNRFGGRLTRVFKIKMICGAVVFVLSATLTVWRTTNPAIATLSSPAQWVYLFLYLILLAAAITAGFFGGKLVFKT